MAISKARTCKYGIDLLSVHILLDALLRIVHNCNDILHLLVNTGKCACKVIHLKDIASESGVEIKISPCIVVKSKYFSIKSLVFKLLIDKLAGRSARGSTGNVLFEGHIVHVCTYGTLDLEMLSDIPHSLTCKTEDILHGGIPVLVKVPVRILVVLVVSVPVSIVTFGSLIVLEPLLVVCSGKSHEVLSCIALGVAESRTVEHIFACIIGSKVKVYRTH